MRGEPAPNLLVVTIFPARRIAAAATTLLLAGCSATVVDGSGSRAKPGQPGSVGLSVTWKTKIGGGIGRDQLSGGSADSSRVYINNDSGHVFALDPASGKVLWDAQPGSQTGTPVGAAAGAVLYYDANGGLTTLDGATGHTLWKGGQLGGNSAFASQPAYRDGVIALPAQKGYVEGLGGRDVRTGKLLWLVHKENYIDAGDAPVVAGGAFVSVRRPLEGDGRTLIALAPKTGRTLWSLPLPQIAKYDETQLGASGNTLLVASQHGSGQDVTLTGIDARTHTRRWTTTVANMSVGGGDPLGAAAGGTLAFGSVKGLRGISLATGRLLYTKRLDLGPAGTPGLCGGQVCSVGVRVLTVVGPTGKTIGEFREPEDPQAASAEPILASAGRTYLVDASYVYALG